MRAKNCVGQEPWLDQGQDGHQQGEQGSLGDVSTENVGQEVFAFMTTEPNELTQRIITSACRG
jgi:hypothetical protein